MNKDFLDIADFSREELQSMLDCAISIKKEFFEKGSLKPVLKGKVMAMIFQKPSLRTRVSFDMGMKHLGGDALYLSPAEIGLGTRESVPDIARVLDGYVDIIMARVFAHDDVVQLAKYTTIPVINGLSDYSHPCQAMTDAMTIIEHYGRMEGLNVAYVGDGNNMAVSVMDICAKLGANFTAATPDGYNLPEKTIEVGRKFASESGSTLKFTSDPAEAVQNADVIYTDTWISMGQEAETEQRLLTFPPYQVNAELVSKAKPSVIVMHCLPAHRGWELTDDVADGPHSVIFPQAHNRLHAQIGIIYKLMVKEN